MPARWCFRASAPRTFGIFFLVLADMAFVLAFAIPIAVQLVRSYVGA